MFYIVIKNLYKRFGDAEIFSDFSHTFKKGSVTALMGRSGVGKTTLLRIILGLDQDFKGELIFSDSDTYENAAKAPSFSVSFQEDRLFPGFNALENITAVSSKIKKESALDSLKKIASDIDIKLPVSALSGGQRRRVALIRALLAPSDILILDEPFSGLDEASRINCLDFILEKLEGRTFIISTHDPEDANALNAEILNLS